MVAGMTRTSNWTSPNRGRSEPSTQPRPVAWQLPPIVGALAIARQGLTVQPQWEPRSQASLPPPLRLQIRQQIRNLLQRQLVEQLLRHGRGRGGDLHVDLARLDRHL